MKIKKGVRTGKKELHAKSSFRVSSLSKEDILRLNKAEELIKSIREKYAPELLGIESSSFPIEIIRKKLTVLESVVKYLKENKNLSLHQIAGVISRDERNIWQIYNRAHKKEQKKFEITISEILIPLSIFSDYGLPALESIVVYMKDNLHLTYHEIALATKRDDRTIWTVYRRAVEKNA